MEQLTNQELISELQKRIQNKTLEAKIVGNQFQESTTLLSLLDGKTLLFLLGLTVAFTFLICYSVKITYSKSTEGKVEFNQNPPLILE